MPFDQSVMNQVFLKSLVDDENLRTFLKDCIKEQFESFQELFLKTQSHAF